FKQLAAALPPDVFIFGLDEHTACILDFASNQAIIKGIGRVTLQRSGQQLVFGSGERFSIDVLRGTDDEGHWQQVSKAPQEPQATATDDDDAFWGRIHQLEGDFHDGLETHEAQKTTNALLELDRTIWQAQQDLENAESVIQARDTLREMIAILGTRLAVLPRSETDCLAPVVEQLLQVREAFRQRKQFEEADTIRDCLQRANIIIEDDKEGSRWRLSS
ncbi:MAG: hypothetical protein PVF38_10645, partial [Desulfobacterales bacterium]